MDPISLSSGVVALTTFGLQTSGILIQTIASIKNHTKTVRDIKADLTSLQDTLQDLSDVVDDDAPLQDLFAALKAPLYGCGTACREFDTLVRKCTPNTTDSRRSLLDWARLKLKASDINTFRTTLSSYKSTLQIAVAAVNLRSNRATHSCLIEYTQFIRDTQADFEERLLQMEERRAQESSMPDVPVGSISTMVLPQPNHDEVHQQRQRAQAERLRTHECIRVCSHVSSFLGQQLSSTEELLQNPDFYHAWNPEEKDIEVPDSKTARSSFSLTVSTLQTCLDTVQETQTILENRLDERSNAQYQIPKNPSPRLPVRLSYGRTAAASRESEPYSLCPPILSTDDGFSSGLDDLSPGLESQELGDGEDIDICSFGGGTFARRSAFSDGETVDLCAPSEAELVNFCMEMCKEAIHQAEMVNVVPSGGTPLPRRRPVSDQSTNTATSDSETILHGAGPIVRLDLPIISSLTELISAKRAVTNPGSGTGQDLLPRPEMKAHELEHQSALEQLGQKRKRQRQVDLAPEES